MADRARHAFGNSENLQKALESGDIDAYDILFLDGDTDPKVGWVDKNGVVKVVDTECVVVVEGETLPDTGVVGKIYVLGDETYFWNGVKFVSLCKPTDVTSLATQVDELGKEMEQKVDATTVQSMIKEHSDSLIEVVEF